jgi:hypothetical protein
MVNHTSGHLAGNVYDTLSAIQSGNAHMKKWREICSKYHRRRKISHRLGIIGLIILRLGSLILERLVLTLTVMIVPDRSATFPQHLF